MLLGGTIVGGRALRAARAGAAAPDTLHSHRASAGDARLLTLARAIHELTRRASSRDRIARVARGDLIRASGSGAVARAALRVPVARLPEVPVDPTALRFPVPRNAVLARRAPAALVAIRDRVGQLRTRYGNAVDADDTLARTTVLRDPAAVVEAAELAFRYAEAVAEETVLTIRAPHRRRARALRISRALARGAVLRKLASLTAEATALGRAGGQRGRAPARRQTKSQREKRD